MRITRIMVIMLIGALLTLIACAPASATPPTSAPTPTATPTASFTTSNLTVTPNTVKTGEPATVGVTVTNNGGEQGAYTVVVKLHDGTIVGTKDVTLAGGAKQNITLDISLNSAGTHMIMVDKLTRSLIVQASAVTTPTPTPPAPTPPAPTPPAPTPPTATGPAAFTIAEMGMDPGMPEPGDNVTVSVKVTNIGGQQGTYKVVLKVDDVTIKTQDVTLAGGASQVVNLTIIAGKLGTYTIKIGELTCTMEVMAM